MLYRGERRGEYFLDRYIQDYTKQERREERRGEKRKKFEVGLSLKLIRDLLINLCLLITSRD